MAIESKIRAMLFPKNRKIWILLLVLLFIVLALWAFRLYGYIFTPNVSEDTVILIPTGSTFAEVDKIMIDQKVLQNEKAFRWIAKKKGYTQNVKPGRYELKKGMNANVVVNKLRNGQQDAVNVIFNNVRTFPELAGKIAAYLEIDSSALLNEFLQKGIPEKFQFTEATFPAMFIPNTYQFYWTTTPEQVVERLNREYMKFWNTERTNKATALGLSKIEVSILASIVQEETNKNDEKPVIAGVYLNRLKRGMLLQACPTVKYAVGDFTLRRITTEMTQTDSPYNTYRVAGLP
ncbi:MAG TPA: endolytic transglycosylase MltG, partial [Prolixibacteraceae bacterium]|nr:endolytic transglycosylase MltG [Prolixibacteraceae bacterium]